MLTGKDKELRRLAQALYEHDSLDAKEIDAVVRGKKIERDEKKVREMETGMLDVPRISFATNHTSQ